VVINRGFLKVLEIGVRSCDHASLMTDGLPAAALPDAVEGGILKGGNPRFPPLTSMHGGGGNRTRVRGRTDKTSTSVVRALRSPGGRFADDLPTG
jgi:hypothetical protein